MTRTQLELYRAQAEELEHLAVRTADERVRWQRETLACAYRVAILVARGEDLPSCPGCGREGVEARQLASRA